MSVNATYLAETALIDLSFALAEIVLSEAETECAARAIAHIKSAMTALKRLAPRFDEKPDETQSDVA